MKLSFIKISLIVFAVCAIGFGAYQIFSINRFARQTLADSHARLEEQNKIPSEKRLLTPHLTDKIQILQNTSDVRAFCEYKNSYYAATGGGLLEISADGKTEKHFTILDGLPESDLTSLAVWNDKLFIGTRTKNLVSFDGEHFENYTWTDRTAQSVNAFAESDGKLLIGTLKGGLIEFDGENFTEITASEKTKILSIIYLSKTDSALYVGTFDDGLWIYESSLWKHFTIAEGLPSNRVVGIASNGTDLYAATDLGLAILQDKTFRTVAEIAPLSSAAFFDNKIFLTKDDGEIFTFDKSLKQLVAREDLQNVRLAAGKENLKLVSAQGVYELDGAKLKPFAAQNNAQNLTDNFVSALAFDDAKNLWIGTFRRGIDVFAESGKKLTHLETERTREINYLQATNEKMTVAAASGLMYFGVNFQPASAQNAENLPKFSVAHFSGDYAATSKGLFYNDANKTRVLSTVQGLPSNSVNATLIVGKKLYAGTLGGLAEIENNRVTRVYKDSNSNLKTNWVTAFIQTNDRFFIGTYGGGIFELLPSGEIRSFESDAGKFVVNFNAFYTDGERLYTGTLTGVKILDLRTQEWRTVKNILPAECVMTITGDDRNIYFGTTNGIARIEIKYFEIGEKE